MKVEADAMVSMSIIEPADEVSIPFGLTLGQGSARTEFKHNLACSIGSIIWGMKFVVIDVTEARKSHALE